ncbi:MAG: DUF3344 domain-containing protein, partial [Candidatus Cloacimonetes bacterium]|nr:DUF3344 domain-containing protein [Candidatus Cloacimonadota bacterium]
LFNNQSAARTGSGGTDPAFKYYDVKSALQDGTNELGVICDGYQNLAVAILEVTKETASNAGFAATPVSGPAPLTVRFNDTSTGTPASWLWDFGDGTNSTEQHPAHTYTAEGNYTVSLTVSNSLGTDTEARTDYISVGALVLAPVAAFSANTTSGDAPLTVRFTDESTNAPTAWVWDFGDGKTSTEQNPSHTYEARGTYTVTLTAANYGGSDTVTKTDYITATTDKPVPVPDFTTVASTGRVPFSVKFTDTTTGDASSWAWDFGDGGTSTEQNPVHTYVTVGSYTVTLAATGPGGTNSTTVTDAITATAPLTSDNNNGGIPLTTVKEGTVSGGLWYDSYPGFATSAEKAFALPDHTEIRWARLYVDVYCGHMQNNYRGNVTIGIDADGDSTYERREHETFNTTYSFPGEGGTGPIWLSDHMNRVTSDYVMWYDLTDAIKGRTVSVQAATRKIDASFDGRIKAMTLVVAYDDGDTDRVQYWVNQGHDTVNPLDETYTGSTTFATAPLTGGWASANLTAIYLASVNGAYTFQGTALASGTPSGSYFGTDDWDVSSMLTAGQDSVLGYDKSSEDYYKIPFALLSVRYKGTGPAAPVAQFSANTTSGEAPLTVRFTDESTGTPTAWAWDFENDGSIDSSDQNPAYTYSTAGTYTVNLTVTNAAGSDSEVKAGYITVTGGSSGGDAPVASFTANVTTGTAPLVVQFTDTSINSPTSWLWSFGDNATSTDRHPAHTYAKAGNYTVTLTATNAEGSDDEVKTDYIVVGGGSAAQVDLTISGRVNLIPGVAVFAREPNCVRITKVTNIGPADASAVTLALYASDVSDGTVPVNTTTLDSLPAGAETDVVLTDPTVRHLAGGTVTYTAVVDPENLITETDETNNAKSSPTKKVLYNGYKGKRYWENGSDVTTVRTYDLRGDIVHSFGDSQYVSGSFGADGWTNYTATWTGNDLPLPAGASVHDVWLYVPYCWDDSHETPDNVSVDFNGVRVPYENWYHDKSNFGGYADSVYGLMTYNVTSLYQSGVNNTALFTRSDPDAKLSPAGFTLAVVYEDPSASRKQIFVNEEFDILGADQTGYGTNMTEATAYVPFSGMTIDTTNVVRANLTTFVPWGNDGEGNLYFNGDQIATRVWNYGPRAVGASDTPQVAVDDREVTAYLKSTGNEAAVQGDETWKSPLMVAA